MRIRALLPFALSCTTLACATTESTPLASDEAKTTYAVGYEMSAALKPFALEPDELDAIVLGLRDGIEGREPRIDVGKWRAATSDLLAARLKERAAPEEEASQKWLAGVAREAGVTTTDSVCSFARRRPARALPRAPAEPANRGGSARTGWRQEDGPESFPSAPAG